MRFLGLVAFCMLMMAIGCEMEEKGKATVVRKEKRIRSCGEVFTVAIAGNYTQTVFEVDKEFFERVDLGCTVKVYNDGTSKWMLEIPDSIRIEDINNPPPLHRRCLNDFLEVQQMTEREHKNLLINGNIEHVQRWEDFRTEWARQLIATEER